MRSYFPQATHFVVYDEYFTQQQAGGRQGTPGQWVSGRKHHVL